MKIKSQIAQWMKIKQNGEEDNKNDDYLEYKILVLGERMVGKSSICSRFAMNEFNLEIKPSTQCECYRKTIKLFDQLIKVYLIDVSSDSLKNPKSYLYTDVKGALLVYDITKTKTFEKIDDWAKEISDQVGRPIPVMLLGNKNDLKFLRNVDEEEAKEKAGSIKCDVRESNCVDEKGIQECIKYLIAKIYYEDLPEDKKEHYKEIFSKENNTNSNTMPTQDNTNSNNN